MVPGQAKVISPLARVGGAARVFPKFAGRNASVLPHALPSPRWSSKHGAIVGCHRCPPLEVRGHSMVPVPTEPGAPKDQGGQHAHALPPKGAWRGACWPSACPRWATTRRAICPRLGSWPSF
ncbi:hypothetical protein PIB30_089388 [Stylosanthes scabra]|uniref:Uncharacterized protein n=1 Tax=Stylosanthes scabra TaxID=79078 RepID=A0ABU6SUR1_9FABA|nr:hypothetical protein [Stylosanthes scabra]